MNPNEYEVEILLKIQAEFDELVKVRKGMQGFKEDIEKSNKVAVGGFKDMQSQLRGLIEPITMVRRTIWQFGIAWSLTAGTIVAAIADIRKKQEELNNISIKTGLSTETASKQLYGFNIASDSAKAGVLALQEAQNGLNRMWTFSALKVTELAGDTKIAAKEQEILAEKIKNLSKGGKAGQYKEFSGSFEDRLKRGSVFDEQATLDIDNLRAESNREAKIAVNKERWEENKKLPQYKLLLGEMKAETQKFRGDDLAALREYHNATLDVYRDTWGQDSEPVKLAEEFYQMQEDRLKLTQFGLRDHYQISLDMQKQFGQSTTKLFGDIFIDAFDNKLSGAKEIFAGFLIELRNMLIRAQLEQLVGQMITGGSSGGSGWLGAVMTGVSALFGGGTAAVAGAVASSATNTQKYSTANYSPTSDLTTDRASFGGNLSSYATGGVAGQSGPELAIVGEGEPELITPFSKLGSGGSSEQTVHNYYYINAVDARSFATLVAQNPEAIVAVTSKAVEQNKNIRKVMRSNLR